MLPRILDAFGQTRRGARDRRCSTWRSPSLATRAQRPRRSRSRGARTVTSRSRRAGPIPRRRTLRGRRARRGPPTRRTTSPPSCSTEIEVAAELERIVAGAPKLVVHRAKDLMHGLGGLGPAARARHRARWPTSSTPARGSTCSRTSRSGTSASSCDRPTSRRAASTSAATTSPSRPAATPRQCCSSRRHSIRRSSRASSSTSTSASSCRSCRCS